jgi:DNA polymerase-3 subunit gamma/tau
MSVDNGVLTLGFDNPALAGRFTGSSHAENVALAVRETLGLQVRVESTTAAGATPDPSTTSMAQVNTGTASAATPAASSPSSDLTPAGSTTAVTPPWEDEPEDDISADDAAAPDADLSGPEAVARILGGTVIDD